MTPEEATKHFYRFIWPHRAVILRTATFLTQNAADAEDLAQETFMRAFDKMERFELGSNAQGWLTAILRNVRIDRSRGKAAGILGRAQPLEAVSEPQADAEEMVANPRDFAALLERMSDQGLIDALQLLPEEIQWTLLLVDVEQMGYEEAAAILEVPAGTVKSRVHRGRRMLREILVGGNRDAKCKDERRIRT